MKRLFRNLDLLQVIGFIISIGVGLSVWNASTPKDPIAGVTLGFVLAAFTQGLDVQKRLKDAEERLHQANALSQYLYQDEWLLEHIQHIVSDYQNLRSIWFDMFKRRASSAIVDCREVLHGMTEGYLIGPTNRTNTEASNQAELAKKSLKAIAAVDDTFWQTPEADIWIQANATAVKRGVSVTRIFTYPLPVLRQMTNILQSHQKLGIEVSIAPAETLPRSLNEDYIIIDDRIAIITEHTGNEQRILIVKVEVEQRVRKFESTMKYAKRLEQMEEALRQ